MEKKTFGKTPGKEPASPSAKPRSAGNGTPMSAAAPKPWTPLPATSARAALSAAPQGKTSAVATAAGPVPTHDDITQRAKALWKAQGCPAGKDVENWLEAERQLRAERGLG